MAQEKIPKNQYKQPVKSQDVTSSGLAPEKDKTATETSISPLVKLNDWFKPRITWILCILVLCWAGIRIAYFNSIVKSPLYSYYQMEESDNRFFDDWAKDLNKDWLNAKPLHPYHQWHREFAEYYLQQHPEKLTEILAANPGKDSLFAGKALWNEWYRGNQYHQEPAYPYMLAVLYRLHLDEVKAMIILQLMLGVLSGVLLFLTARKYFGETVAVLTGILYFFCGILMYNEIILLRTSWSVFLTILMVFLIEKMASNQRSFNLILCGLGIGFSFLMQSTFFLFLIGAVLIILFSRKQSLVLSLKNSGLLVLGFFIMFSPVIIRNMYVGAPTFSTSSVGPVTFISTNAYGVQSATGWGPDASRDVPIISETYNSLGKTVIATLKTHPTVLSYLSLFWRKLKAIFIGIEYPNNDNYYFYKLYIPALQIPALDFFWIAPLALAGLLFSIYRRKKHFALYLAILVQLITLLAFYVLGRLRAPLVIICLPLAAFAIVECINIWDYKKSITLIKCGLVLCFIYLSFSAYSSQSKEDLVTDTNYRALYFTYFKNRLDEFKEKKQWDKWLALQKQMLDMEPGFIRKMGANEVAENTNQLNLLEYFNTMHFRRNAIYDSLGDKTNAAYENDTFKVLDAVITNSLKSTHEPVANTDPQNFISTGLSFKANRKFDSAIIYFKKALAVSPENIELQKDLGNGYLDYQNYDSAEVYFKKILAANANEADAINGMGCIYFVKKDYPRALEAYKKSVTLNPNHMKAYSNLGRTYFVMEQYKNALEAFGKARSLDPQNMDDIDLIITSFQKTGKTDSVKKYEALARKK